MRSEERRIFLSRYYPFDKSFQDHAPPPAAAATATTSSSSVINSSINSKKIYSVRPFSRMIIIPSVFKLSNPRKTYVSPKDC